MNYGFTLKVQSIREYSQRGIPEVTELYVDDLEPLLVYLAYLDPSSERGIGGGFYLSMKLFL